MLYNTSIISHDKFLLALSYQWNQRNFFSHPRAAHQLKFGTSVFHSYVHQWSCQLLYNPRLNDDWGLSDGEGLERIWSKLASLVGALRYTTQEHRLCALHLLTQHFNKASRKLAGAIVQSKPILYKFTLSVWKLMGWSVLKTVRWMLKRFSTSLTLYNTSNLRLNELYNLNHRYSAHYFITQWNRQRESQLRVMVTENSEQLNEKLSKLVELEERHQEAECATMVSLCVCIKRNQNWCFMFVRTYSDELKFLRAKRRRERTEAEQIKIGHLPQTLQLLAADIETLVGELGGDHYRDMPGSSSTSTLVSFN